MKADWEVIKRGDVMPQYAGLHVTLNPKGDIVMSRFTWETMGGPKAFYLMWDAPNQRIGLLRTVPEKRDAYPVRIANSRTKSRLVRGHRLVKEKRIDLPHTVQFRDARIDEDGILVLDLRTATESNRAKRHYRNQSSAVSGQQSDGEKPS